VTTDQKFSQATSTIPIVMSAGDLILTLRVRAAISPNVWADGVALSPALPPILRKTSLALVFPKSSRIGVRHRNRLQVFSALESELYRNSQPHRGSPFGGEWLLFKIKRQNGLRMQRARHVYTGRIAVKAGEGDITRPQIRADAAQKEVQRHTAPLPDLAPSFNTDVPVI